MTIRLSGHAGVGAALVAAVVAWPGCGGGGRGGDDSATDTDVVDDEGTDAVADTAEDVDGDADEEAHPATAADYLDRPMVEQVAAIDASLISGADLLTLYMERLAERDDGDEGINAVIALDPGAVAAAVELDGHRGEGALLQGAVILVKDNIDTAGLATTAGSLAMAGNVPDADAPVVAALRAAGGVVLGKTNLSEWAGFRGYALTSGWSSLGGQTKNGYDPRRNPCGSSSGSAAAIAAGLASASLGTETSGSIVCPASMNGVVGFKPTVGLVSRAGVIPISSTNDTVGPITRTVADAARMLSVMAGPDPDDPATLAIPDGMSLDFEAGLAAADFEGVRIGRVSGYTGRNAEMDAAFEHALDLMGASGATVVDVSLPGGYRDEVHAMHLTEFKVGINLYLDSHARSGQPATLAELIAFNDANADTVMPHFGQELFEAAEATTGLDDPGYLAARDMVWQITGEGGIVAVLEDNDVDVLAAPTAGPAFFTNYVMGDFSTVLLAGEEAAAAGCPHLTLPMGMSEGMPVGLSLFAGPWDDGKVLALGYAYERLAASE